MPLDDTRTRRILPAAWPRLPLPLPRLNVPALPDPGQLAERAINALLRRESWARETLLRHAGKTVRIVLRHSRVGLTITSEGFASAADPAIVPDVTVTLALHTLSLSQLLSLRNDRDGQALMDITRISGDAGLAQAVGELARHLRLDVEDELAQRIGDAPAMRVLSVLRGLSDGVRSSSARLGANVAEYLSEERHVLLGKPMFDDHCRQLADTLTALDALEARLDARAARQDRTT